MKIKTLLTFLIIASFLACSKKTALTESVSDLIYVRNDGADMPAHIYGNAATKCFNIIVHGGPGDNGLSYRIGRYHSILEKEMAMVYWDQRGQGMAHGHYSQSGLNIPQMSEDLYYLVKSLKQKYGEDISIFIMGHSWGGTLGTAFMIDTSYQKEVKGWIEVDGAHDMPLLNKSAVEMFIDIGESEIDKGNNKSTWKEIVTYAKSLDTSNISLNESAELNYYSYVAEELISEIKYEDYNSVSWFFSPMNPINSAISGLNVNTLIEGESETINYTPELHKIKVPCLFLWGKYDFNCPLPLGQSAYEKVGTQKKELYVFQNSGHSPMDNEVDLFCDKVIGFVKQYK